MMKKLNAQRGFTLMELMVVIVIVAILAAVAVPLYINYVNDAKETEGKGAIGAIVTAQQAYKQVNGTYATQTDFAAGRLNVDLTEASINWTFTITASSQSSFTVRAAGNTGRPTATLTPLVYTYPQDPNDTDPWH